MAAFETSVFVETYGIAALRAAPLLLLLCKPRISAYFFELRKAVDKLMPVCKSLIARMGIRKFAIWLAGELIALIAELKAFSIKAAHSYFTAPLAAALLVCIIRAAAFARLVI